MPEVVLGFLLGFAMLLVILIVSRDIQVGQIASTLNAYNGVITALATIAIALFTLFLKRSTDRLWDAGERQIDLLRESGEAQSRDMRDSIEAVKEANNVAERALIAGQRPWVHAHVAIDGDMKFDDQGNASVPLLFILKNIGRSPATGVRVNTFIFLDSPKYPKLLVRYRKFCDLAKDPKYHIMSLTLFPEEQPREVRLVASIGSAQFREQREFWRQGTGQDFGYFVPHLVACVTYAIPFDDRPHQTGIFAQLKRRLFGEVVEWGPFNMDERAIPSAEMRLVPSYSGSPHID